MTERERIALIDRLRALPTETEWFEFKRNRYEPQLLGEYLSALANAACLAGQPRGYLVFGIDDATHDVVGTDFDPYATKAKGNQDLLPWLAAGLRPNTGFEPHVVAHPDGRVVLFEIGPANGEPVGFYGTPYIRVGTSKTELGKHDSTKVIAAVKKWSANLDPKDKDYEHQMTEALWVHQWHNVVDEDLLKRMLRSPDYHARAAATRVLCYWRDRVKDPLALLEVQVKDENPRVRLEAVRACSFFTTARAAEIALAALDKEADPNKPDYYIKYCLDETMRQLDKYTK